jgi:hypothetical protein
MLRLFTLLAVTTFSLFLTAVNAADPAPAQSVAAKAGTGQKYRAVIQVSDSDAKLWAQAINNTENLQELLGKENVDIEIVALGQGIGLLKLDSPHANRVAQAMKAGVKIVACGSTMKRQKLTKDDMLPDIGYVPGGLIEIMDKQREGWSYIKG